MEPSIPLYPSERFCVGVSRANGDLDLGRPAKIRAWRAPQVQPEPGPVRYSGECGPLPLWPGFLLRRTSPMLPSCRTDVPTRSNWHTSELPGLSKATCSAAISQLSALQLGLCWMRLMTTPAMPAVAVSGGTGLPLSSVAGIG